MPLNQGLELQGCHGGYSWWQKRRSTVLSGAALWLRVTCRRHIVRAITDLDRR
jgi:hypothetical protein